MEPASKKSWQLLAVAQVLGFKRADCVHTEHAVRTVSAYRFKAYHNLNTTERKRVQATQTIHYCC